VAVFTTASRTWATSEVVTATNLNAQLRDLINGFGAKTSYTPTLAGFTLGNGTISGSYTQIQKTVWFEATFVFGSTSAAASAVPTLTLPVTAASSAVNNALFRAQFIDSGTASYFAVGRCLTTTTAAAYVIGTNGIFNTPSTTSPFTWATNDGIYIAGLYEAA
jgi:hypothetical protein